MNSAGVKFRLSEIIRKQKQSVTTHTKIVHGCMIEYHYVCILGGGPPGTPVQLKELPNTPATGKVCTFPTAMTEANFLKCEWFPSTAEGYSLGDQVIYQATEEGTDRAYVFLIIITEAALGLFSTSLNGAIDLRLISEIPEGRARKQTRKSGGKTQADKTQADNEAKEDALCRAFADVFLDEGQYPHIWDSKHRFVFELWRIYNYGFAEGSAGTNIYGFTEGRAGTTEELIITITNEARVEV